MKIRKTAGDVELVLTIIILGLSFLCFLDIAIRLLL